MDISSPCVKVCKLDATGNYCVGCGRTTQDIKDWDSKTALEKRFINAKAKARVENLNRDPLA